MVKTSSKNSSQKSPAVLCLGPRKHTPSPCQHMFLEDFCRWFSIDLAKNKEDRFFYDILPEKSPLKGLLLSQNYTFLEYDLNKLLAHVMHTLVFVGKAFVEVVLFYDEENNVTGISLVPIDPILSIPCSTNTYFAALPHNRKPKFFKINNRNIILFHLSDLGFRRYSLRKFYNKLTHFDSVGVVDMSLSPQKTGFDFTIWNDKCNYKLLKVSKKTGWHGRRTNNPYMGDAYLLYRAIQFKSLRRRFLDYFLKQINESLALICKDLGSEGTIIAKRVSYNYDEILQRLHSGEINYSQLSDCVFNNKEI